MSCDKLVFDLSQEVEGSPNVFIRKDWINIMDNQNQSYQSNQCIIDTSQLANSNKYMAYREGYLAIPLLLSMRGAPETSTPLSCNDYSIGLKNWFGSIIHSITLDYNGTTIIQQTPFCNLWSSFKLLTTLSWNDVYTQGATIGFYPDTPDSFQYYTANSSNGYGITNNALGTFLDRATTSIINNIYNQPLVDGTSGFIDKGGNAGATIRTKWIAYNPGINVGTSSYGTSFLSSTNSGLIWKSNIVKNMPSAGAGQQPILQIAVMATVYLKHLHSFFNMVPLLKGVFMKLTMNLNNSKATITCGATTAPNLAPVLSCSDSSCYVGGIQPLLIPSGNSGNYQTGASGAGNMYYDLTVGSICNNNDIRNATGSAVEPGNIAKSVYLYVPAYTFNPTFETAYLSNNIKQIKYTDIYQYYFDLDASQAQFNQLITNGISNIKSVLIIPFYKTPMAHGGTDVIEYTSPFSTAGGGTTAPMATLVNFNVQISGQNAIYNTQRYTFEEWNNQLYGQNAVNGGLTDGLTSGLIDFNGFNTSYAYYYVNVERMLPVEQSVPKSVQVMGTTYGNIKMRCMVFVEYGCSVAIDVLTGARV